CKANCLKAHLHISKKNRRHHSDYGIRKALGKVGGECPDVGNLERRTASVVTLVVHGYYIICMPTALCLYEIGRVVNSLFWSHAPADTMTRELMLTLPTNVFAGQVMGKTERVGKIREILPMHSEP
ncbi:MAG: hypothetical protein KAV87_56175, partial [Desulfobacteraceae bacterium]|nr:hypothetical protein [Desulfobacteraceae bacterium]